MTTNISNCTQNEVMTGRHSWISVHEKTIVNYSFYQLYPLVAPIYGWLLLCCLSVKHVGLTIE